MIDKRGVPRGKCQFKDCDCEDYEPEEEGNNCDYCGHKPVSHVKEGSAPSLRKDGPDSGASTAEPTTPVPPVRPTSSNGSRTWPEKETYLDSFSRLEELPEAIIFVIMESLDAVSLCRLCQVSVAFSKRARENDLWQKVLVSKYDGFRFGTLKSSARLSSLLVSKSHFDKDTIEYFSTRMEEDSDSIEAASVYRLLHTTGWARRRLKEIFYSARPYFGEAQLIEALISDYDSLKERFLTVGNQSKSGFFNMVKTVEDPRALLKYFSAARHSLVLLILSLEKVMKDMLMFLHDEEAIATCLKSFSAFDKKLNTYMTCSLTRDDAITELEKTYLDVSKTECRLSTHKLKKLVSFCAKVKERQGLHCSLHRVLRDQIKEMQALLPLRDEASQTDCANSPAKSPRVLEDRLQREVDELIAMTTSITFPLPSSLQAIAADEEEIPQCRFCREHITGGGDQETKRPVPSLQELGVSPYSFGSR